MASQRYHPSITDNCETTCCKPVKDYFMEKKGVPNPQAEFQLFDRETASHQRSQS